VTVQGNRFRHLLVEVEAQPRAEHGRPQHAHRILDEAHLRIADRADDAPFEVLEAAVS